jgi:hypothetical protein
LLNISIHKSLKVFSVLIILCCSKYSFSQTINDAGLWTTATIEKEFNKASIFLTEEFRLRENLTQINLFYTDIGVSYKVIKPLKISLSYRSIEKYQPDQTFNYRHRLMLDVTWRSRLGSWTIAYRQRLQSELRNINRSPSGTVPEWYARSKFQVKYDLNKPVTPYIGTELRYQIKDSRNKESDGLWHRVRYFAGLDYKLNDTHALGVYYLIQHEFNVVTPQNLYIVGLEYTLSLF